MFLQIAFNGFMLTSHKETNHDITSFIAEIQCYGGVKDFLRRLFTRIN